MSRSPSFFRLLFFSIAVFVVSQVEGVAQEENILGAEAGKKLAAELRSM